MERNGNEAVQAVVAIDHSGDDSIEIIEKIELKQRITTVMMNRKTKRRRIVHRCNEKMSENRNRQGISRCIREKRKYRSICE